MYQVINQFDLYQGCFNQYVSSLIYINLFFTDWMTISQKGKVETMVNIKHILHPTDYGDNSNEALEHAIIGSVAENVVLKSGTDGTPARPQIRYVLRDNYENKRG